jgi:hypothetical protein
MALCIKGAESWLAPGDVVITPAVDRLSRDTTDLLVIARDMQRAALMDIAKLFGWIVEKRESKIVDEFADMSNE